MTIYDISQKAGVSIATVSRVLNNSAKVSSKTKKKVLDVINECGYAPNIFARGLGLGSMNSIGILCADSSDIYLAKAVYYIEHALKEAGYNSILACTGYDLENKKKSLDMILNQRVQCVILVGSSFVESNDEDNDYIRKAADLIPVMLLNADFDYPGVYCTLCDDFKSTMEITTWLLDNGRKNILYLYNSKSFSGIRKLSGFRSAILLRELPFRKEYEQYFAGLHDDIDGVAYFLSLLKNEGIKFDAVVCADDMLGVGAVKYAKSNHLQIPKDISITGYNNSILTYACDPELTSINNHLEKLCTQLVKTCITVLSGGEAVTKVYFSGDIVFRGTT